MGRDTQLVRDGTHFIIECGNRIAGCGGWSFRATLYGGDNTIIQRAPARLDPATDAAKVRAMYTDPDSTGQGIGSRILTLCEKAAPKNDFRLVELMSKAAGEPFYRARGYIASTETEFAEVHDIKIPLLRMQKRLE